MQILFYVLEGIAIGHMDCIIHQKVYIDRSVVWDLDLSKEEKEREGVHLNVILILFLPFPLFQEIFQQLLLLFVIARFLIILRLLFIIFHFNITSLFI